MKLVIAIRDLAIRAGRAFARVSRRVLSPVFGDLAWSAPPWARWTGTRLAGGGRWLGANPKRAGMMLMLLAAIAAGGVYGYKW